METINDNSICLFVIAHIHKINDNTPQHNTSTAIEMFIKALASASVMSTLLGNNPIRYYLDQVWQI